MISSLYDCMVNIKLKYNFVETPCKFIFEELSIRKLGSSLQIESSVIINLCGVSTKLHIFCSKSNQAVLAILPVAVDFDLQ